MSDDPSLDLFGGAEEPPPPKAAPEPRVWTVSQVNRAVRSLLETAVDALWVAGEVTNWTRSRQGHCYFTLKDDKAQLRCVLFAREAAFLPTDPQEGMRVRVFGSLTLYEPRGDYQILVRRVEGEGGEGLWRLAFERLRAKLEAEGLLDPARKRRLPRFPATVGVVTSATGAALHDVLTVLRRRSPWVRVLVSPTRVQGEGASQEVAEALRRLDAEGSADVIIVGRGGGSVEDLWAFNEEPLARAIAACATPVVSAVGHEVDVTISDLVADLRAPTPSAGAEAVVPDGATVRAQIQALPPRLARGLRGTVTRRRARVDEDLARLRRVLERRLAPPRQALDLAAGRLERGLIRSVERKRVRLSALSGRLQALSPLAILERGYAVPRTPEGQLLRGVDDFTPGRGFLLRVKDGTVRADAVGPHQEDVP